MSWQYLTLKVDWPRFLKSFPKPDAWSEPTRKQLSYDDVRWGEPWVACYQAMTPDLPEETRFAVDGLVRAMTYDPPPKPKGFKPLAWYEPHRDFDPEDFQGPASGGELIPTMSPGDVVDLLHRLRTRPAARIEEDFRAAWGRPAVQKARKRLGVDGVGPFLEHFAEWREILEEVEAAGAGFALDLV